MNVENTADETLIICNGIIYKEPTYLITSQISGRCSNISSYINSIILNNCNILIIKRENKQMNMQHSY